MQNRLPPRFHGQSTSNTNPVGLQHRITEHSRARIVVLGGLMFLPIVVILIRLAQMHQAPILVAEMDRSGVLIETISAPAGRILTADGVVLAEDRETFELWVDYRQIQREANPHWLARQARAVRKVQPQLTPQQAERRVLRQRAELWNRIANTISVDRESLDETRSVIERRLQRMRETVLKRREERAAIETKRQSIAANETGWTARLRTELTSPPKRSQGPLILREELQRHRVAGPLPIAVAAEIESHPEQFPGCEIRSVRKRVYPQGELAAHLIGTRKQDTDESTETRGTSGLERSFNQHLSGDDGQRRIVIDRHGNRTMTEVASDVRPGSDLQLTLHSGLQRDMEAVLRSALERYNDDVPRGAAVVAMDVTSGEILAAASAPLFDLEKIASGDSSSWQQVTENPARPLFPRALAMALPPGSVFKSITAVAALQSGVIDDETTFHCAGYLNSPRSHRCYIYRHHGVGHGPVTLTEAIRESCNVCFFQIGQRIGPDAIVMWASRFGFGQPTGIDVPGEVSGNLPSPANQTKRWTSQETLALSIGQSRLTATPLQITRMMAAIANDGQLPTPTLVRRAEDPQSIPVPYLKPETLRVVRAGLEEVVSHPRGTGHRNVHLQDVAIAGKTGTAEVGGDRPDHAWFTGYLPADRPQVAFTVVIEHGGNGGSAAGPVARSLAESLLKHGLVKPSGSAIRDANVDRAGWEFEVE